MKTQRYHKKHEPYYSLRAFKTFKKESQINSSLVSRRGYHKTSVYGNINIIFFSVQLLKKKEERVWAQ